MKDEGRIEELLLQWHASHPPTAMLVDGASRFGYGRLATWSLCFANALAEQGVQPGDRVAIHLEHGVEAVVALHGAWIAGAIAVPVDQGLKSPQVAHILQHSGSRRLVTSPRMLARLDGSTCAGVATQGVPALEQLGGEGGARDRQRSLPGGATPAAILFTSGSTGRPKGILLSHANLLAGARIVAGYLGIRSDERILSVLPFSFDYGLNQLLTALRQGCTVLLQRSHSPADLIGALASERITALAGVPALWIQLMRGSPQHLDLPHLRYITNSGGTFPVELLRRYRERLPHVRIFLMYGLSEAFRSTFLAPEQLDLRPDSIGLAIPECEVLVLDASGAACAADAPGELVHRGPTVALGYWQEPAASALVFRPDPDAPDSGRRVVHSGDVVRRDLQGFLYFIGRRDQLIKCHGYRVCPNDVEEQLHASHLVAEVAVHGRPDAVAGSVVVAHVVPADPSTFTVEALMDFCRSQMPAYMVPSSVEVHDSFPRRPSGKVDLQALAH